VKILGIRVVGPRDGGKMVAVPKAG